MYNFLVAEYDYDLDMKMQGEETRRIAFNEGIAQGISQGILTTAIKMKKANFDISTIIDMTGLSKQEIERL